MHMLPRLLPSCIELVRLGRSLQFVDLQLTTWSSFPVLLRSSQLDKLWLFHQHLHTEQGLRCQILHLLMMSLTHSS